MKIPSNDLFSLISSMTKDEKHFFRKFASIQGEDAKAQKNYLMLFNAIDAQEKYDEEEIKKKFERQKFIVQLHVTKIYLEGLILKSLFLKTNETTFRFRIKKLITDADILFAKGLYLHCAKKLQTAKKLAYKTEFFDLLLQIISLEIDNENRKYNMFKKKEYLSTELYAEYDKVLLLAGNLNRYEEITNKLFSFYLDYIKGENIINSKEFKKIYRHPLLKDVSKALSYKAKMVYHFGKSHMYNITEEYIKDYKNLKMHLNLMEENSASGTMRYFSVYNNFLSTLYSLKKFRELNEKLDHVKDIVIPDVKKEKIKISAMQFRIYYLTKFLASAESGNIDIVSDIDSFNREFRIYSKHISGLFTINLIYGLSFILFAAGRYDEALLYANKILNDKNAEMLQPFYTDTLILSLAIHYELGNKQLLEYSIKPVIHRLKKMKGSISKKEKVYLKYLQKHSLTDSEVRERKLLEDTLIELKEIDEDKTQKVYLQFLDIYTWIESKINKESYRSVLKRKFKKMYAI